MKIKYYSLTVLSFVMILYVNIIKAYEFETEPVQINFFGATIKEDTIAVLGDYGSMLLSYDDGKTWMQKKIFDSDTILKLFIEDDRFIVFQSSGFVKVSFDKGQSWELKHNFFDTLRNVIKIDEGYLVRLDDKLIKITSKFEQIADVQLRSEYGAGIGLDSYLHSLEIFNDNIVVSMPNMVLKIFDNNLNFIKDVSLSDYSFCDICTNLTRIVSDNKFLYFRGEFSIGKTDDLSKLEKIFESPKPIHQFILKEGSIYNANLYTSLKFEITKINFDSIEVIAEHNEKIHSSRLKVNDFYIYNNKILFIGDRKLIFRYNLDSKENKLISDFSGFSFNYSPDHVNDSTFIFYSGSFSPDKNYGTYQPWIYTTENNGATIRSSINFTNNPKLSLFGTFKQKYYDSLTNRLFFTGYDKYSYDFGGFMVTKDLGQNFEFKELYGYYFDAIIIPNIQKINKGFVTAINGLDDKNKYYTNIIKVNNDFEKVDSFADSNFVILHIHSKNDSSFVLLVRNTITGLNEIKYTDDKFLNRHYIKTYSNFDSLLYYYEYKFQGSDYLFICLYNKSNSILYYDALNIEKKEMTEIYKLKIEDNLSDAIINTAFYCDGEIFYLSVRDTLFYIDNLSNMNPKKHFILPQNGRISRAFKKYDDKFFARYFDSTNILNIYWLKLPERIELKPTITVSDLDFGKFDIKDVNYKIEKVTIRNISNDAELLITAYEQRENSVFVADLPYISEQNPLIIKEGESYEFEVGFRPQKAGNYSDTIIFMSNAKGVDNKAFLKGEAIDSLDTSINFEVDYRNYLYSFPPYPLPASKEVRALVYWDTSIEIDVEQIAVYNIYGVKVAGPEKIRLDKLTSYSGNLIWDCSAVESGIYVIHLKHGTENRIIKVIVTK